ncbi:MAG: Holliday junction resolvase RuvX [Tenericutes bacterium]|jgi:putative Holliday junction resolvase|nr:Holliday junction resolvase RuvX [Bacilli bacterium]MDD4623958.1 Holliday junction resolvase RuvX [Bacilli bacterium]NLV90287.1 Holliday junction resolvase RuvX [Mycoplasmatota bacterium]
MRVLGLDFGTKTLGLAISDNTKTIATSLKTLRYEKDYKDLFNEVKEIIEKNNVDEIVLGYPINMNDTIGERAESTLLFKQDLENFLNLNIVLEDERLTTREATKILIEADMSRKKRKKIVDKVAASFILQSYLDRRKNGSNYY